MVFILLTNFCCHLVVYITLIPHRVSGWLRPSLLILNHLKIMLLLYYMWPFKNLRLTYLVYAATRSNIKLGCYTVRDGKRETQSMHFYSWLISSAFAFIASLMVIVIMSSAFEWKSSQYRGHKVQHLMLTSEKPWMLHRGLWWSPVFDSSQALEWLDFMQALNQHRAYFNIRSDWEVQHLE